MGGRGSPSQRARAAQAEAKKSTTKAKESTSNAKTDLDRTAENVYSRSVQAMTKGLTKEKLKKLSRSQLEKIAITQATKANKEFGDKWTKGGITVTDAFKRAVSTVSNQTTAQLRSYVWKYRNLS